MASNTENVKLGVCSVTFGGVDLGYTKGGVDVTIATTTKEVMVDQFGNSPINEIIIGRTCTAKVPLAETTMINLARIMPGAVLNGSGGAYAGATVTFVTAPPVDGDKISVNGVPFTFRTVPVSSNDIAVASASTIALAAAALKVAIDNCLDPLVSQITATVLAGLVTLTADDQGVFANAFTLTKTFVTGANVTVTAFTGGVDANVASVTIPNGVGISLLQSAKVLVFHPQALALDDRSEDFTMPLANTPGQASFGYKLDNERVFNVDFKAYPDSATRKLFVYGDARSAA
jgi:hypothetical protein